MFFVTLLNYLYWFSGATLGGIFGSLLKFNTEGLDFVMTAMFVVIFMEQWLNEVERYSIRVTTLEQYKAVFRNVISIFPAFQNVALRGLARSLRPALHSLPRAASQRSHTAP